MDAVGYFKLKNAWHSGNQGCSPGEMFLVISATSLAVLFAQLNVKSSSLIRQYIFLVIPLFLSLTDAVFNPIIVPIWLFIFSILSLFIDRTFSFRTFRNILSSPVPLVTPWITNFRALTFLVTAICILAVDFTIFPRRFAKTETFGISVMDFGVGFFIVCNGIVAKKVPFSKSMKGAFVMCILGVLRVLSIKSIDYYEHVSEYGRHWNFFFTLAGTQVLNAVISRLLPINPLWLSIIFGLHHQSALEQGLQKWALSDAPRTTFLEANREGIVSLAGYLTLLFASQALGKLLRSQTTYGKLVLKVSLLCVFFWFFAASCSEITGVSRRLCNLGFILCTIAFACTLFLQLIVINIILQSTFKYWHVLPILNSINRNGLFLFLVANILTGMININLDTLIMTTPKSCGVVLAYCFGLCVIFHRLYLSDVVIKFW